MAFNVCRSISKGSMGHMREMESVSSDLRIRRAANDAAGLTVSEGLRSQLTRWSQNVRNTEAAADLLQVVEGSLGTATAVLQRMRVLAMRSSDAHLTDGQRGVLTAEYKEASIAMDRIAQATVYNNRILLAGFTEIDTAASTAVAGQ
jgi:flagellin